MIKILFIPLNRNHVSIFESITRNLAAENIFLCHDKISESNLYHTQDLLKEKNLTYLEFSRPIVRSMRDSIIRKIVCYFKIRSQVKKILKSILPHVCVLAMDNDPIARIFIAQSKKFEIKTILIQEALIRPHEYSNRKTYRSDYIYSFLSKFGIYISYSMYGSNGCEKVLAAGPIAAKIFNKRGVRNDRIVMVGFPKYDETIASIKKIPQLAKEKESKTLLYAASSNVIRDSANIFLLNQLVDAVNKLGCQLVIKLHPRGDTGPAEIGSILKLNNNENIKINKSENTFDLLKKCDAMITVSSTVVLEALMLGKECIVASYLAGESRLDYTEFDALHTIENESEIFDKIECALFHKKSDEAKNKLLEAELYKLDGQAGYRAASEIMLAAK
jgi:predicted glycosyltransferase